MKCKLIFGLIVLVLLLGCNPELKTKCYEAKELTLRTIDSINEYNTRPEKYGDNLSYEYDVKTYNKLCGDTTGEITTIN